MKKKRFYQAGAVFEFTHCTYILAQVGTATYNLISLEHGSNRWTRSIKRKAGTRRISDRAIRKLIGVDCSTRKLKTYSYLGQFPEVFEQMGK